MSQPVIQQYCGKTVTFSLNDPVTFKSFEVLNSECIDSGLVSVLKACDDKALENIRLFTVCICLTERYTTLKTIVLKAALAAEIQMAIRAIVYIVQQIEGNSILDSATIKAHQMN